MYARQVGEQVVLVMDEEQAEELYVLLDRYGISTVEYPIVAEVCEALGPVMEG